MAESIFRRISRLLSASAEDAVDQLERAGGEAVMREAIREADRAIDQVKAEHETVMARRLNAVRQQQLILKKVAELTEKAGFAVAEGRDDLAEAALSRQIDFEAQAANLDTVQALAREEETRLEEGLAALQARKRQMEDSLTAFLASRRDAALGGDNATRPERSADKKVTDAEQAFDRAMAGTGGVSFTRTDAETVNKVAAIDALQKSTTVAARLAELKARRQSA
jgi:phage shock protein A